MNQVLQGQPMTVFGDGTQTRAFSYIDDVAPIIARRSTCRPRTTRCSTSAPTGPAPSTHWPQPSRRQWACRRPSCMRRRATRCRTPTRRTTSCSACSGRAPRAGLEDGLARMARWVQTARRPAQPDVRRHRDRAEPAVGVAHLAGDWTSPDARMPIPTPPLVSCVVLNTNRRDDTLECLRSLQRRHVRAPAVLVLDCAVDRRLGRGRAARRSPTSASSGSSGTLGTPATTTSGSGRHSTTGADWVFILNEDTVLAPECIARLVEARAAPTRGSASSGPWSTTTTNRM